jgi:hypothetical protein
LNEPGTELLQIQSDRFAQNWRKLATSEQYPRYNEVRRRFAEQYESFADFIAQERLGPIVPDQCEVAYVDHIEPSGVWAHHGELHKVFAMCRDTTSLPIGEPEEVRMDVTYVLSGSKGEPIGRLCLSIRPALRNQDRMPIFVVQSVGRGRPMESDLSGVLGFMDMAHDRLISAFSVLMTAEMQQAWGPQQ